MLLNDKKQDTQTFNILDIHVLKTQVPIRAAVVVRKGNNIHIKEARYKLIVELLKRKNLPLFYDGYNKETHTHVTRFKTVSSGEDGYFDAFKDALVKLKFKLVPVGAK